MKTMLTSLSGHSMIDIGTQAIAGIGPQALRTSGSSSSRTGGSARSASPSGDTEHVAMREADQDAAHADADVGQELRRLVDLDQLLPARRPASECW